MCINCSKNRMFYEPNWDGSQAPLDELAKSIYVTFRSDELKWKQGNVRSLNFTVGAGPLQQQS